MAGEVSTIQSLKAVDAWIDVINGNINGGVRTAFKASRLKFAGSNTTIDRAGTSASPPLQFPEPSLVTANTVIDFAQGAITASHENTHLAIQGEGFFLVADPATIDTAIGVTVGNADARFYLTRDGEFHTNADGLLVNHAGYFLVTVSTLLVGGRYNLDYDAGGQNQDISLIRPVYNDLDLPLPTMLGNRSARLSEFIAQQFQSDLSVLSDLSMAASLVNVSLGQQSLRYTPFGSTVFDFGFTVLADATVGTSNYAAEFTLRQGTTTDASVVNQSLEASNASMTQSVPELSLAQKLFSALTKVLQTKQTNIDGVINLIR